MHKVVFDVAKNDLIVAKINAAVKILEWAREGVEPGIGGTPGQLHVALAEAFRAIYSVVDETVGEGSKESDGESVETGAEATGEGFGRTRSWNQT